MTENPTCLYCGEQVTISDQMISDHNENILCNSYGWVFEYTPGIGTHSLPEEDRRQGAQYKARRKTAWDYTPIIR